MGNQLNRLTLKQNLINYQSNNSMLQLFQPVIQVYNNNVFKWKQKNSEECIIQKKYKVRTEIQFYELLDMFALRFQSPYLLATKYLKVKNQNIKAKDSEGVFQETEIRIFYEQSIANLTCFEEIPQQDAAYFLMQSLKGFQKLKQKINFPFQVTHEMFHITQSKEFKIWFSEQIWSTQTTSLRPLNNESQMISQILAIVKQNVFFSTQSNKSIGANINLLQPFFIDKIFQKHPQTFNEAIDFTEKYFHSLQITVGKNITCLKHLESDDIYNIMRTTKLKIPQNSFFLNPSLIPPSSLLSKPLNQQINFLASCVNNEQTLFKKIYLDVSAHRKNYYSEPSNSVINKRRFSLVQGKRLEIIKAKKRVGLSLTRNMKQTQSNSIQNINIFSIKKCPHYCATTKIRPISSQKHQSGISIFSKNCLLKETKILSTSSKINTQKQNYLQLNQQSRVFTSDSPLFLRTQPIPNVYQKIIILNKEENRLMAKNQNLLKNLTLSQNQTFLAQQNTKNYKEKSFQIENYSSNCHPSNRFSRNIIVNFPVPICNISSMIAEQNFNLHKTLSNNSSFDTKIPNQSLARFHKQFIINDSMASSKQQFVEIPKIYVHSPKKTQPKIFTDQNTTSSDSSKFKQIIEDNNLQLQKNETKSGFLKQKQAQQAIKTEETEPHEYNKFLEKDSSVFTRPALYDYLTKNSIGPLKSSQFFERKPYIDHLSNANILESLDYQTIEKIFENCRDRQFISKKNLKDDNLHHFSINDFPTIEQIEENSCQQLSQRYNVSFEPVSLNFNSSTTSNQQPLSSVRRGSEQSIVEEYKKFYDDTNRSNKSPNKHYFSPLKKNGTILNQESANQINTKNTTFHQSKKSPSPLKIKKYTQNCPTAIYQNQKNLQTNYTRNNSPSPLSKFIYNGKRPSINPLLLQDMQKLRNQLID